VQDVNELSEQGGHVLSIEFSEQVDPAVFRAIPGVSQVTASDRTLTITAGGDLDAVSRRRRASGSTPCAAPKSTSTTCSTTTTGRRVPTRRAAGRRPTMRCDVFRRELADHRRSVIGCSIGALLLVALYVFLYPTIKSSGAGVQQLLTPCPRDSGVPSSRRASAISHRPATSAPSSSASSCPRCCW